MSTTEPRKVIAIVGAGDAIGASAGRRFAKGGYTVCLIRRSLEKATPHVDAIVAAGGRARAFSTDARDEGAVVALFETIERDVGPLGVCLFNAGANTQAGALETTGTLFQRVWQLACFAGFVTGREAARHMLPRAAARSCSPVRPPACAAAPGSRPSPPPRLGCAPPRKALRASSGRKASMSRT